MQDNNSGRTRRSGKSFPKHVKLTEFGRNRIEAWAQTNNVNFSAAIETLALMGLEDQRADYAIPALRATTLQGLQLAFNRLARLLSIIATDAATSRMMSEAILLQIIRELADENLDDFEAMMRVPRNSRQQRDVRIRQFHDLIKQQLTAEANTHLKQPVSDFETLLRDAHTHDDGTVDK